MPGVYGSAGRRSARSQDAGAVAAASILFRPLPPLVKPQVTRLSRLFDGLTAVLVAVALVSWMIASGAAATYSLAWLGQQQLIPVSLLGIAFGFGLLCRRVNL